MIEKVRTDDVFDVSHFIKPSNFYQNEPNLVVNQVVIHNCHAGGVLIGQDLNKHMPLIKSGGKTQSPWSEGQNVRHLEPLGFVKFDILGIGTLRMFERAIALIIKNDEFKAVQKFYNDHLHPDVLNFDDPKVYQETFHKGNFVGVFQFAEPPMQNFTLQAKPTSLDEITTLTSIWRPGPIGSKVHELYIEARNDPSKAKYFHPLLREILGKNYGLVVYQEDLAWIAHKLGKDVNLEEGNLLRKVLVKRGTGKGHEVKDGIKVKYLAGCEEKGISKENAEELWEKMEKMSQYCFNRCLHGDSLVRTENGEKKIKDVIVGEKVDSINGFVPVKNVFQNGRKKLSKIKTETGKTLTCTLDHKLETREGMKTLHEILSTDQLKIITKDWYISGETIIECFPLPDDETYDLEVDHPDHSFFANDISVSNSHALCYSVISFQCAWFLTYYPAEWLCAYLDEQEDEKKASAIGIAKSMGFTISPVNINTSGKSWVPSPDGKTLIQPLSSIKGLGEKAIAEVLVGRPYKIVEDLLFNDKIKYNKLNKKGIDVLIRSRACDMLIDTRFKNAKHFYLSCAFERPKKPKDLEKNLEVFKDEKNWTEDESIDNLVSLTSVFPLDMVVSPSVLTRLKQKMVPSIGQYDPLLDYCWFITRSGGLKKTSTGKDYLVLTVLDESGKQYTIKVWGFNKGRDKIYMNKLYIARLKHQEQYGFSINGLGKNVKMIA